MWIKALEGGGNREDPGSAPLASPSRATVQDYRPGTAHGGHDGADGRGLRYLEWHLAPDPDGTARTLFAFLLGEADGSFRAELDEHRGGLFPRERWLDWLRQAGFAARALPFDLPGEAPHEMFLGIRNR